MIKLPKLFDMHCHLRDPGQTHKEDIITGCAAARAGGYGAVVAMPNTSPVCDNPETVRYVTKKAQVSGGGVRVYPAAAITVKSAGEELCDFDALSEAGAAAFTDDGRPVSSAAVMYRAMLRCAEKDYLIISHAEELSLAQLCPPLAEPVMVARDLLLAEETGCRLHIAHVSTERTLDHIRRAKARGVRVTVETCPHYFSLTREDYLRMGVNAQMNPPLARRDDANAVIEALRDGTIDCISTDHAPHSADEKAQTKPPNGITGLETAFSVGYTYLVKAGHITLGRLCELMSDVPAKILGVAPPQGTFSAELEESYVWNAGESKSKSKNSPYDGIKLYGRILPNDVI